MHGLIFIETMRGPCYYIVYFSLKSFYLHFRSFETYSCIISYCVAFYLSTFSHDAVHILASPESITGGAPNCKTGELNYGKSRTHEPIKGCC